MNEWCYFHFFFFKMLDVVDYFSARSQYTNWIFFDDFVYFCGRGKNNLTNLCTTRLDDISMGTYM